MVGLDSWKMEQLKIKINERIDELNIANHQLREEYESKYDKLNYAESEEYSWRLEIISAQILELKKVLSWI